MNDIDDKIKQLQLQELLIKQERRKLIGEMIKYVFMLAGSILFIWFLIHITF